MTDDIETLTHERVKHLFHYDAETGAMTRRVTVASSAKAGDAVGSKNNQGYLTVKVDRRNYKVQHLAWLWMTGNWPQKQIDHVDGNKSNNSWANLREATHAENMRNKGMHPRNTSGYKGVSWYRQSGKWQARIKVYGKEISLGYFNEIDDAASAYAAAAERYHGIFRRDVDGAKQ